MPCFFGSSRPKTYTELYCLFFLLNLPFILGVSTQNLTIRILILFIFLIKDDYLLNWHQLESPEKEASFDRLLRSYWPVAMSLENVIMTDWCGRDQPTVSNTIPRQVGLEHLIKLVEQARKSASKKQSLWASVSLPWLLSIVDLWPGRASHTNPFLPKWPLVRAFTTAAETKLEQCQTLVKTTQMNSKFSKLYKH